MAIPESVEVTTGDKPRGSVIWLHGLGADGHDFAPIVPELGLEIPLRFVFPHAPVRPVTISGGMPMRAWYDILNLDAEGRAEEAGVRASGQLLDALIAREVERGIAASDIVIAGFSQGGAIVLHTVLNTNYELAGAMALSTYLPLGSDLNVAASRKEIPFFMAHGSHDPMLPLQWGRRTAEAMESVGYTVAWHEYPMAHAVCPQEIADISAWLRSIYL